MKLADADAITAATLAEARRLKLAPIAIAVLDSGGNLVAFKREDGSGILRFNIAFAKAWGSLGMGYGSRELSRRAEASPAFFTALSAVSGGKVAPSPGGVLILQDGVVIGAAGVTGDTGDNDEACAIAGIKAAGLQVRTGVDDTL